MKQKENSHGHKLMVSFYINMPGEKNSNIKK